MAPKSPVAALSQLAAPTDGVFRAADAERRGVTRDQVARLCAQGVITRALPDTYTMASVRRTPMQRLRVALMWAGDGSAAAGRSGGMVYELEGVRAPRPEIVVRERSPRHRTVMTATTRSPESLMIRTHRGLRVTGPEATLVRLGHLLDDEQLEIACEHARRRRLTSVPALNAYLDRFGTSGRPGVGAMRGLLDLLDQVHASRSTLEVKTRRLLVARGMTHFVREFPLEANGRTYRFDFGFPRWRTILETNGRRWHDDPLDYENDNEKWSLPGRYGFKVVFATWSKVTRQPDDLIATLRSTLAA